MNAYVAITDYHWFHLLAGLPSAERDDENFWTPSPGAGRFQVLPPREPLLFKLRAEHGGFIVGGGSFAHYTELPISIAWGAFRASCRISMHSGSQARASGAGRPILGCGFDRLHPARRALLLRARRLEPCRRLEESFETSGR